jgi:hypothetical protein
MFRKLPALTITFLVILLLAGMAPAAALANNPLAITLTPTEGATDTPEPPTETPLPPPATETPQVQPPESSATPTSQLATPPAPTETPEEEEPEDTEEPEPTRPAPVLPETGDGPANPPVSWTGLLAALLFASLGTLVFRFITRLKPLR